MKKIMMIIVSMLLSTLMYSQTKSELPKYHIVDGDTIGVIITVEYAQKIANDQELLKLYEKLSVSNSNVESGYIQVVNDLEQQVAILTAKDIEYSKLVANKDLLITNLNLQIDTYKKEKQLLEDKLVIKDQLIDNMNKNIKSLKTQKTIGFIGAGAATVAVILLLISK